MTQIPSVKCIVIGAGFSGVATGCQFKQKLDFHDFVIYDRAEMYGGTWFANTYPGCGVDIPSLFYSLSFAPNPDFTKLFPDQPEILEYIQRTARQFDVERHIKLNTSWLESSWSEKTKTWRSKFQNRKTGEEFYQESRVLISAAGGLVEPNKLNIEGADKFEGNILHSARWDHSVSLKDKKVCLIGNGCSGTQIVPAILPEVTSLTQFIRSPQWYFPRKNPKIPPRLKWGYRNIPGLHTLFRTLIFMIVENAYEVMLLTKKGEIRRQKLADECTKFIREKAPEKYWDLLTPNFSVGCKRRIFDPGYIDSLNADNMHLTNDPIVRMEANSVVTKSGTRYDCDVFIAANGFAPIHFEQPIRGRSGQTLQDHWASFGGQEAYKSTALADFPNFFMIAGPNSATSYGSVVYSIEGSVELVTTILKPLVTDDTADTVEITPEAEKSWASSMQAALKQRVMSYNCQSYYVDRETGWNYFNYPWSSYHWWFVNRFPEMKVWRYKRSAGQQRRVNRQRVVSSLLSAASAAVAGGAVWWRFLA